jgi:hypothetical protein
MMLAFLEILIESLLALGRFVARNFRPLFALSVGAGLGLAIAISLAKFGDVSAGMILMAAVIGAAVVAPRIIDYLNRIAPRK